ncbi:prephenate dehydrogenase [Marivirga tractuosa]|uniref:Prephenate dehydrogenase n=1 Tax=Marivirga tractuosa (strain ATCC 23168 / DSM 4126 / NBRC 15989 / NCIMB 1408 / VKM B-1430 / H-43) TaxID=643867 RepID=E4TM11_MARTH|nr:prephenate dehydrogenase [Marivirga tractuosa]ADR20302.1 Prephenate dehydrogenase [Marivirga tractuosa DSM 4126]BDD15256.1 prephenate dehydrogenase [Marivirga tractuosa]
MNKIVNSLTVIGLGLIGGSFALAVKNKFPNIRIYGVDQNPAHASKALEMNIIDEIKLTNDKEMLKSDVIILAIPVSAIQIVLSDLLSTISNETVVIDTGSTKGSICESVYQHPKRAQFVAAHPIAGTEYSGPEAAFPKLFEGKKNIICEFELCNDLAKKCATWLFETVGINNIFMDAENHDKHLAYVSHLSHISSFMLGLTVLNIEKDEKNILNLAGSGFASTVRLAKSSPEMWTPIFTQNKIHLSNALKEYILQLKAFEQELNSGNSKALSELMKKANEIKKVLD